MIELPQNPPFPSDGYAAEMQRVAKQRLEIKRACQQYARERGWRLSLQEFDGAKEIWWASKSDHYYVGCPCGSFQKCCRAIVEWDMEHADEMERTAVG